MELKNNQGVLFKNEKTKDTQPDYNGEINVEGKTMRIAIWRKQSSKGTVYLSVQVSEPRGKEEKREESKETKKEDRNAPFVEDDIPW